MLRLIVKTTSFIWFFIIFTVLFYIGGASIIAWVMEFTHLKSPDEYITNNQIIPVIHFLIGMIFSFFITKRILK